MSATADTIDVADLARSLRRGWRLILGSVAVTSLVALGVILFAPRVFSSTASVVVRSADAGGSLLTRAAGELAGGSTGNGAGSVAGGVSALLGGGGSGLETEVQILQSEAVLGAVIDSLRLQAVVRSPSETPSTRLVRALRLDSTFDHLDLDFRKTTAGIRVSGDGVDTTVAAGGVVRTPVGTVALRETVPEHFTLRVLDREDALKAVGKRFIVKKGGGDVLKVSYRASDPLVAAEVPNVALVEYLRRKRTSDRGVNAQRAEFLTQQIDSIDRQLAVAEQQLRRFQERSGLLDAEVVGKLELEQMAELRTKQGEVEVEAVALDQLLSQIASGKIPARQLIGFPAFLKSAGINSLLQQLSQLETERTRLLERRLETDPEVVALDRSIKDVEGQLIPLARSYQTSLARQRAEIGAQAATVGSVLGRFPGAAEEGGRLLREVKRLGVTETALRTQLVQAQLNTVAEGGDVRSLDRARIPRRVAFPEPVLTAGVGVGVGLVVGLVLALFGGSHGKYLDDQYAIERSLGVPTLRFDRQTPLLMSGRTGVRTVLLLPVQEGVDTTAIAERLVDTALARGETATIVDLTSPSAPAPLGASVGAMVGRLEQEHALVVVRLPGLAADSTAAVLSQSRAVLLVAPARRVHRRELAGALDTLRRLDVPCAGVVMTDGERRGALRA